MISGARVYEEDNVLMSSGILSTRFAFGTVTHTYLLSLSLSPSLSLSLSVLRCVSSYDIFLMSAVLLQWQCDCYAEMLPSPVSKSNADSLIGDLILCGAAC